MAREAKWMNKILGNFPKQSCAVKDNKGNHCLETPVNYIIKEGKEFLLCDKCYKSWVLRPL